MRYGAEMEQLLDDLQPATARSRLSMGWDLLRGALDAHLTRETRMDTEIKTALRRGILVALMVWAVLSVEIVLSNVVFPTRGDDDSLSVLLSYMGTFAALALTGVLTARVTTGLKPAALAGAVAGALIGALTVGTFFFIDNVFLDIIAQQESKITGLAQSGMTSMRAYVNTTLAGAAVFLTCFFAVAGAGLAVAAATAVRRRRA
jgi:hypothetical protein